MAAGHCSDVVMARLAPMRLITLAARVSMLVVGSSVVGLVVLALARWQRDGFTAAELAGRAWSGRARDAQEDIHNVGPAPRLRWWATQAGSFGWVWAFAAVAVFPALARG
jgi:hypothetical protein